ncbi:hypothetical protein [Sphingosinicella terrae]|uniref:hypothetical protein n=1 Tax=Sphingosinicella terrae TaxID=2172047 RepID=UPI0013B3A9E8|nr:hypothetical protein [Sphingosinicella terrae]
MASVLFTALALIAAGQAGPVPAVSSSAPTRCTACGAASAPAAETRAAVAQAGLRRQG